MNLRDHPEDDGKKVWLSEDELDQLVNTVDDMEQRVAIELGGRCGLRSKEILDVASQHVVETDAGHMLRVWKGKGDKYRETPISESLATKVEAVAYRNDRDPDEPVLSVGSTRSSALGEIRRRHRRRRDRRRRLALSVDTRSPPYLGDHPFRP